MEQLTTSYTQNNSEFLKLDEIDQKVALWIKKEDPRSLAHYLWDTAKQYKELASG